MSCIWKSCSKAIYNRCKQQVPPVALRAQKNEVFRGLRKYHVSPWDDWVGVSWNMCKNKRARCSQISVVWRGNSILARGRGGVIILLDLAAADQMKNLETEAYKVYRDFWTIFI